MRLNYISNEPKWLFWKLAMKNPNNWEKLTELKHSQKCFECSTIQSIEWKNYYAYDLIDDKVIYFYYCEPCYTKWVEKE